MATSTKAKNNKENAPEAPGSEIQKASFFDENIIASIVINGDISRLTPEQKVAYYRQFCSRVGLDPLTQPFKLLRLNGKEILYCDRSGTAQLNKVHLVSHDITNREQIMGCYVVTAKASTPDQRHTESIGAVNIDGLKGEPLCNAMMKAETKAKRRATLDLLGLGILDESETDTMPFAEKVDMPTNGPTSAPDPGPGPFKRKYENIADVEAALAKATDVKDIANLYYINAELVESSPEVKAKFTARKNEFFGSNQPDAQPDPPLATN